jgi:predicted regulator of Ras-like GTPase activity (Roadblock/LC7/MglB family)
MVTEAYSNPLQTVVDEFKTLSPETNKVLIFRKSGQIVANTKAASEDQAKRIISNFTCIASQSQSIGDVEYLTIQAGDSQLIITAINNLYLATVSSRATNQEIIKSLTQVVVPTVVHLVDQIASASSENEPQQTIQLKETTIEKIVLPIEEEKPKTESFSEPQPTFQHFLPKTPVNQFMVEKIGGILVQTDSVRIDSEIIAQWSELYDGKQITMVNIEALDGKKTTCKFKPIREAKANSKGIIQVPEKILQTLQTEKGKLVMVKPVIE